MKHIAPVLLAFALTGCWAGFNDTFSAAECGAFGAQYLTLGGISPVVDEEGRTEIRERTVRDCKAGALGLSREEYACAMKAGSRQDWIACGIVLKG